MRILFASDVLVDYLGGVPQAQAQAQGTLARHANAATSLLNWIE